LTFYRHSLNNSRASVGLKTTGHRKTPQDAPQNTTGLTTGHQELPKLPN